MHYRDVLVFAVALSLGGCALFRRTPPPNSGTATEVTAILQEVKAAVDDVKVKQDALVQADQDRQTALTGRDQFVADHVNAAATINEQNPAVNEHTQIVGLELAPVLPLLPTPTAASQLRTIKNLQLALEKTEAAKRELELNYALERKRSEELGARVTATQAKVAETQAALTDTSTRLNGTVTALADKEAEIRVQAAEAERQAALARQEAASKTRLKVAYGFMGLGGLIAVAAIVATFLRVPGVLQGGLAAGGALMFLGWMITYIEDLLQHLWFRVTTGVVLAVVLGLMVWMVLRALRARQKAIADEKISVGALGAIQELKNDDQKLGQTNYAPLRAKLQEWYVDDDGKPDAKLSKEIDQRLVDMNLINPKTS